jgi:DNA-directed RNA polymerase subunit RPC12/RpoP
MKIQIQKAKFLVCVIVMSYWAMPVKAGGIPVVWQYGEEKTIKVVDFPQTPDFKNQQGEHIDAGFIYKQFCIFWIPVWNYDERWCGYIANSTQYQILTKAQLDEMAQTAGITLTSNPSLPVWDAYGGKLCLAGLVAGYFIITSISRSTRVTTPAVPKQPIPQSMPRPPAPMHNPPQEYYTPAAPLPPPPTVSQLRPQRTQLSTPPPLPPAVRHPLPPAPETQELKCTCAHCGQKLAFDQAMLHRTIECPACKRHTTLVCPR